MIGTGLQTRLLRTALVCRAALLRCAALACRAALLSSTALLSGCGAGSSGDSAGGASTLTPDDGAPDTGDAPVRATPSLKDLGPGTRRVVVLVLPGDASVEVDGNAARRRDGVIELIGKVGQSHRLRIQKGADCNEEEVIIKEDGASPPVVYPYGHRAPAQAGSSPGKPSATAAASSAPADKPPESHLFSGTLDD